MKYVFSIIAFLFCLLAQSQTSLLEQVNDRIDQWQLKIDEFDGQLDGTVTLLSKKQSLEASTVYLVDVDWVQEHILQSKLSELSKRTRLLDLEDLLEQTTQTNYFMYHNLGKQLRLIKRVSSSEDAKKILAYMKSDPQTALSVFPFYDDKEYALEFMRFGAQYLPAKVLLQYKNFSYTQYASKVMDALAEHAPMNIIYYMGAKTSVRTGIYRMTSEPNVKLFLDIYKKVGSNSKAYLLMEDIQKGKLTAVEAHQISRDKEQLFNKLLKLRAQKTILADFSVDDELTHLSLLKIKDINQLHEEPDRIRFEAVDTMPYKAEEIYTLMVYGEDEIYTSTFLGLFNRMMEKMDQTSSYQFLHDLGLNKYRTFIKMCANYNTLPEFLTKMKDWEKDALFGVFIKGLDQESNPLEQAVAIADTYGSLKSDETKTLFKENLKREASRLRGRNNEAERLISLLMELFEIQSGTSYTAGDITTLSTLFQTDMFKDGQNIQQHFFFDDEDGRASFATFVGTFRRPGWKITNYKHYSRIESTSGKKVILYANTAKGEYDGIPQLRRKFEESGRFPDITVHRGHSYYAQTTIESLTPNTSLVILGSCGGYNNVSSALTYAPEAQIITSKQVGTMWVNNQLIFTICEYLRKGKDLNWDVLWPELEKRIPAGKPKERFADYIPPHKNMGAILIRNYRKLL
jgi:hypothetical protein